MIKVKIPVKFLPERKYAIGVIIGEFLGLEYSVETVPDARDYSIMLENGNELVIKDGFFSRFEDGLEYLKAENIPAQVNYMANEFTGNIKVPIIFGDAGISVLENKIVCGTDLFASSFFMLARWEEYAVKTRDKHGRFPATASLAGKCGFLSRSVVNEYVEMLWRMLVRLGLRQMRRPRDFKMVMTHDVDELEYRGGHLYRLKKMVAGDAKDPYDTFDILMDHAEEAGLRTHFFFMAGGSYDINGKKALSLLARIDRRGHRIGFHPSYGACTDTALWKKEYQILLQASPQQVRTGRQHYLRFENPKTWRIWEENGMEWDSTLGYPEKEGFRCGVCYEFSVFDILERKKLKLMEKPLIAMDVSFLEYQDNRPEDVERKISALKNEVKKYNGSFVLLWHNHNFNTERWKNYRDVYKKVITANEAYK